MDIGFEGLLISLAFILPGFLTSTLVIARTPLGIKPPTLFAETFESLLRSVYINLIAGPLAIFLFLYANPTVEGSLIQLADEGLNSYLSAHPIEISVLIALWLVSALILATIFGYIWDPLDYLTKRLKSNYGTNEIDPWYMLREDVQSVRGKEHEQYQFWVQTRLKNGDIYQGEFAFVSLREENESRELLLRSASYLPNADQVEGQENTKQKYDAVLIDTENCSSIEVLFTEKPPPRNGDLITNG